MNLMKKDISLIRSLMTRLSVTLAVVLVLWAFFFYMAFMDEAVDEVDDSLEVYSESVAMRFLSGELSAEDRIESNNSYSIKEVSEDFVSSVPHVWFLDGQIWVDAKNETEPARIMNMIFRDGNDVPWLLTVSTPTFDAGEIGLSVLFWISVLYAVLFIVLVSISYFVIQKSMKPLYALLSWMDRFDLGTNNAPLKYDRACVSEFRRLNEAANQQVARMLSMYEQQKRFVDHAAHEMQTPVAVSLNRLEQLQQNEELPASVHEDIMNVLRPLRRLKKLHSDMLKLSRIENRAYSGTEQVNVTALVRDNMEDLSEIYADRGISCSFTHQDCSVEMNPSLAGILFGNLLRNAWLHTPAGGTIEVRLDAESFSVSNSGNVELDRNKIFEKFHRGEDTPESNGLGLSMCESICRQYGFRLDYAFFEKKHVFSVNFNFYRKS